VNILDRGKPPHGVEALNTFCVISSQYSVDDIVNGIIHAEIHEHGIKRHQP
jgi:hypothetical protein